MRKESTGLQSDTYLVNGSNIRVNTRVIEPRSGKGLSGRSIVLLPGWGVDAHSKSASVVADAGQQNVLVIDTKPQRFDALTLHEEATAIAESIRNGDQRNVTIVGYSEGGIKAASLSIELQKTDIGVEGLVLMSSPGFYRQKESDLVRKFFRISSQAASQIKDKGVRPKHFLTQGLQSAGGIVSSVGMEVARTNLKYARRIVSQLRNIAAENKIYREVTVPVVLIQGKDDVLSDPEITVPGYRKKNWRQRQERLQETIFPRSPYVRMVTGERHGIHAMPYLRSRQIARVSLGLVKRAHR
jgi:pimeloyl-ACP methyl ester carboxylesterase